MAIQTNYDYAEAFFPEAYLRIGKVMGGSSEEEYFEPDSYGNDVLKFKKKWEHAAYVFVYANEIARRNQVPPIYAFTVEFEYDPELGGNIYKEAYKAVKQSERLQEKILTDL